MKTKIYFVGLGGIGSQLCEPICRFVNHIKDSKNYSITFIDGDVYDESNHTRQSIDLVNVGEDKATSQFRKMKKSFSELFLKENAIYITKQNIESIINPDIPTIILAGVDNQKTRHVLQEHCLTMNNVLLLSGGNNYTDGDVQIYAKRNGEEMVPPIWNHNPGILNPQDRSPEEIGCDELIPSEPQLIFANGMVAACISMAFYNWYKMFEDDAIIVDKSVIYFDIPEMSVVSTKRN